MRQTILVTGAAGFIGSKLARHLIQDGYDVVAVDNVRFESLKLLPNLKKNSGIKYSENIAESFGISGQNAKNSNSVCLKLSNFA